MIEDRPEFQEADLLPIPDPFYFDIYPNLYPSSAWLDWFKQLEMDYMLFVLGRLEAREESR